MDNVLSRKFFGMLSLAMKAGALSVGEGKAQDTVRDGGATLIILSADASENTTKRFSDMGAFRDVAVIQTADREALGRAIGRESAVVIAVKDGGFSKSIKELFEAMSQ